MLLNQLTETLTKNYKVSFTYDAEGLRTGKTVNGEKNGLCLGRRPGGNGTVKGRSRTETLHPWK